MNTAPSQSQPISLSFNALQFHQLQTHILSRQKLSISFSGRRLLVFFYLTVNKTRKCVRDYGPGYNLKALYLCENKKLPAALYPVQTDPSLLDSPPASSHSRPVHEEQQQFGDAHAVACGGVSVRASSNKSVPSRTCPRANQSAPAPETLLALGHSVNNTSKFDWLIVQSINITQPNSSVQLRLKASNATTADLSRGKELWFRI